MKKSMIIWPGSLVLWLFVMLLLPGCGDRTETVYREKAPPAATQPPTGHRGTNPSTPAEQPAALAWDLPPGWETGPSSGMRLATFYPFPGDDSVLCTLVPLKGHAGGLFSNVVRWLEQMGESAPPEAELKAFLDGQETFTSSGNLPVVVVDLSTWVTNRDEARGVILAAVVTLGEDSLFVKMSGPFARVTAGRAAFIQLCRSLRLGEES